MFCKVTNYVQFRTHFGQYQASSAGLGWLGNGDCYLMHRMHSGGWSLEAPWKHRHSVQLSFLQRLLLWVIIIVMCKRVDTTLDSPVFSVDLWWPSLTTVSLSVLSPCSCVPNSSHFLWWCDHRPLELHTHWGCGAHTGHRDCNQGYTFNWTGHSKRQPDWPLSDIPQHQHLHSRVPVHLQCDCIQQTWQQLCAVWTC